MKGNFVGEDCHSAEYEDSYEQDIHAHGGFDQRECVLGSSFWRLSHNFVVGKTMKKLQVMERKTGRDTGVLRRFDSVPFGGGLGGGLGDR